MAADCTVIAADHPDSAADEVIGEAGFLTEATVTDVTAVLRRALTGERPAVDPETHARQFDWDRVATDALEAYTAAANGEW